MLSQEGGDATSLNAAICACDLAFYFSNAMYEFRSLAWVGSFALSAEVMTPDTLK